MERESGNCSLSLQYHLNRVEIIVSTDWELTELRNWAQFTKTLLHFHTQAEAHSLIGQPQQTLWASWPHVPTTLFSLATFQLEDIGHVIVLANEVKVEIWWAALLRQCWISSYTGKNVGNTLLPSAAHPVFFFWSGTWIWFLKIHSHLHTEETNMRAKAKKPRTTDWDKRRSLGLS